MERSMAKGGRSWIKLGCFGFLALVLLLILVAAGLAVTAWNQVHSEQIEKRVFAHEIPAAPRPGARPGQVVLDLSQGAFTVEPARRGDPLYVVAHYDTNSYELAEIFDKDEKGCWNYRLDFHQTSAQILTPFTVFMGGSRPEIRILLPPDVLLNLTADLREGCTRIELGGLRLASTDITFRKGDIDLTIGKPLHSPMERFTIRCAMGSFRVSGLGNASPRSLEADFSMGGIELDLRGRWVRDADIEITTSMAGGEVRLPRNVVIEGLDFAKYSIRSDDLPAGLPKGGPALKILLSSRMGDLQLKY